MMRSPRLVSIAAVLVGVVSFFASLTFWERIRSAALPAQVTADSLVVHKSHRLMVLYSAGRAEKAYRIALGANPIGHKRQEGDERTPEGRYHIDWRNARSVAYRSLHISYPSALDSAAAAASQLAPGGMIMIHGLPNRLGFLGPLHRLKDWTNGCIAVTNREMDELWRAVPNGTPIRLLP